MPIRGLYPPEPVKLDAGQHNGSAPALPPAAPRCGRACGSTAPKGARRPAAIWGGTALAPAARLASPHATALCLHTRGPVAGATRILPAAGRNTAFAPQLERASHQGPDFQIQKSRTRWRALDRPGGGTGEPLPARD